MQGISFYVPDYGIKYTVCIINLKYRKDPVTEFFRRGFYLDVAAEVKDKRRRAQDRGRGDTGY